MLNSQHKIKKFLKKKNDFRILFKNIFEKCLKIEKPANLCRLYIIMKKKLISDKKSINPCTEIAFEVISTNCHNVLTVWI